ncbi:uncharacterized protein LOC143431097 [Xylocopa sonorina]|uniref:uncharacterized protein LOC143431097 n=1 Tax=Xylocopa sonorina TaxID=1818115 RepID=UPI00403AB0B9
MKVLLVTCTIALLGFSSEVLGGAIESNSNDVNVRAKRSPQDRMCGPPNGPPCMPPMGPPPDMPDFTTPMSMSSAGIARRAADGFGYGSDQAQESLSNLAGTMGTMVGNAAGMMPEMAGRVADEMGNMAQRAGQMMG